LVHSVKFRRCWALSRRFSRQLCSSDPEKPRPKGGSRNQNGTPSLGSQPTGHPTYYLRRAVGDSTEVMTAPGESPEKKKPSSIERIQRLEKLEEERLRERSTRRNGAAKRSPAPSPPGGAMISSIV